MALGVIIWGIISWPLYGQLLLSFTFLNVLLYRAKGFHMSEKFSSWLIKTSNFRSSESNFLWKFFQTWIIAFSKMKVCSSIWWVVLLKHQNSDNGIIQSLTWLRQCCFHKQYIKPLSFSTNSIPAWAENNSILNFLRCDRSIYLLS